MVQFGVESEDGWRPAKVGPDKLVWVSVPGTNVSLQVLQGLPAIIMPAFAADINEYVETLRDPDSASWTPTNSVATSNHLNGTAMDLNWDSHPFRVRGTFTPQQMAVVRELLEFYEDTIFWAGDWSDPIDEMHWQMAYGTYQDQDRLRDFVSRKIRPDGFSTFRRGNISFNGAQVLSNAMLNSLSIERYQQLLPAVQDALAKSDCTTVNRIAMWCAQIGHESGGLQWMEELASGQEYEGRTDLGNVVPGDGRRYKGRGPIQVTGRHNYAKLSEWAYAQGLVPTPSFFIDNPDELASDTYGFYGAIWYWTVARPQINELADRGDLEGVTRAVNGGLNGLEDTPSGTPGRRTRWRRCLTMGSELLGLVGKQTPSEGFLMGLTDNEQIEIRDKVRQLWGASFNPVASKSRYANPKDLWPSKDFPRNDDGFLYDLITEHDAALGDPAALARVRSAAAAGDLIAAHFLEKLESAPGTLPVVVGDTVVETGSEPLPPSDFNCWRCGKNYPHELPSCPFCGADKDKPELVAGPVAVLDPVSPKETEQTDAGKHALPGDELPVGDLPAVDHAVIEQLSLLRRFGNELPETVTSAIDHLIPVLKGLAK